MLGELNFKVHILKNAISFKMYLYFHKGVPNFNKLAETKHKKKKKTREIIRTFWNQVSQY